MKEFWRMDSMQYNINNGSNMKKKIIVLSDLNKSIWGIFTL